MPAKCMMERKQGQSMPFETKLVPDKKRNESNCEIDSRVKRVTGSKRKENEMPVVSPMVVRGKKEGEEEETSSL